MKLLSSDFLVVGISTVIIATFSSLLYVDFTSRLEVADAKEIGTITFKKRVAQRKYGSQVIWEDVEQKAVVYNNDSIRTSDLSEAVINLSDGTSIELDENSMILLAEGAGAININFTQGTMYAKRGDLAGKSLSKVNIISKDATVSIEKSDVKLSKIENRELNLSVSKGTARIKTSTDDKIIKKNQNAVVIKDTKEAKIDDVKLKLVSPVPNRYYISSDPQTYINFSWEPLDDVTNAVFEISRDRRFSSKISSRRVVATGTAEKLSGGEYYWRLRAQSKLTGRPEYSDTRKFSVISDKPVNLIFPEKSDLFSYTTSPPLINFKWGRNAIASAYILEIARDAAFKQKVVSETTGLTGLAVDSLGEGTYYWRVRTRVSFGDPGYSGKSAVATVTVNRKKNLDVPEPIAPGEDRNLSNLLLKNRGVIYSWKSVNQVSQYEFVVASDREFRKPVHNAVINGNFVRFVKDLSQGKYFWRVRPVAAKNEISAYSSPRSFNVIAAEKIRLLSPANNGEQVTEEGVNYSAVEFSWSKGNVDGRYYIELSREKNFMPAYYEGFAPKNALKVDRIEPGKYYWRVRLLDDEKSEILQSDTYVLTVKEPAKEAIKTTLVITAPVAKAAVYVNGKLVGHGRVTAHPAPGRVVINITARGYHKFEKELVLSEGDKQEIKAEMELLKQKSRIQWSEKLASQVNARPLYHQNVLVASTSKGMVYGLNAAGRRLWSANLKAPIESTPVADKSSVYLVTTEGVLFCLNITSGGVRWKKNVEGPLLFGSKPLLSDGKVFVATSFGNLVALTTGGKELWRKTLEGGVFSSLAYNEGVLYVGTDNHRLNALKAKDGDDQWQFELDSRMVSSSPLIYRGMVYVGCYSGTFYAISIKKGEQVWQVKAGGSFFSTPTAFQDIIYVGSLDGFLYALNVSSGAVVWKYDTGSKIYTEPAVENNIIYVTSGRNIFALSPFSGVLQWKTGFESPVKTSPTAVGNDVYLGLQNGEVVSLRSDLRVIVK